MKTSQLTCILTTALGILGSGSALAQAWQTVDLFAPPSSLYAIAADIGTGPDGRTLYSVGSVELNSAGLHSAMVRMSADSGASWTTVDSYLEPGWPWASYRAFGLGANGSLLAGGELWDGATSTRVAIIRQSDDGGATWATVEAFQPSPSGQASYGDVKMNPYSAGDIYAVGFSSDAGVTSWAVRKQAAGAATFTTVDLFVPGAYTEARAVAFHPTAGIFVVGRSGPDLSNVKWTVRQSLTGEAGTWSTVDAFQETAGGYSIARGIAVGPAPSYPIYVCGKAIQAVKKGPVKNVNNWVVRRSLNGGTAWSVVDRFGAEPASTILGPALGIALATGVTVLPSGKVFVTGNSAAPTHHIVRKGTTAANGTMTWVTSDDYQHVSGQDSEGQAITSDIYGNIFSTGKAETDSTGLGYLLTRKLTGPQ